MKRSKLDVLRGRWNARKLARVAERCGDRVVVEAGMALSIRPGAKLRLGEDVYLFSRVGLHLIDEKAVLEIGDRTYLNRRTEIVARDEVVVGADCAISWDVVITDSDEHWQDGVPMIQPVHIGDHVWIGATATAARRRYGRTSGTSACTATSAPANASTSPAGVRPTRSSRMPGRRSRSRGHTSCTSHCAAATFSLVCSEPVKTTRSSSPGVAHGVK